MKNEKSFSIRINPDLLKKAHYVADYEGRSGNGQIVYIIRKCVEEFEKEHGIIDLD